MPCLFQLNRSGFPRTLHSSPTLRPSDLFLRHYTDSGFGAGGFHSHDTPYFKINITASNVYETMCGHLLQGSLVGGVNYDRFGNKCEAPSHSTVAIEKVMGVLVRGHFWSG